MENERKLEEFQQKIDANIKIEPKDWMPEKYRQTLIRQISQHAHSGSGQEYTIVYIMRYDVNASFTIFIRSLSNKLRFD